MTKRRQFHYLVSNIILLVFSYAPFSYFMIKSSNILFSDGQCHVSWFRKYHCNSWSGSWPENRNCKNVSRIRKGFDACLFTYAQHFYLLKKTLKWKKLTQLCDVFLNREHLDLTRYTRNLLKIPTQLTNDQ